MIKQYKETADAKYWTRAEKNKDLHDLVKRNRANIPLYRLLSRLIKKDAKVLEGGSGSGWLIAAMNDDGYDWTGIDYSEELIDEFKSQYPSYAAKAFVGDARKLPFEDNSFEVYFSPGVIEHYEEEPLERHKILEEAKRVVKLGGKLLISVPIMNIVRQISYLMNRQKKPEGKPFYQAIYTREELKERLAESGLAIDKWHGTGVHDIKAFGIKVFPKMFHSSRLLNRYFCHMALVECTKKK
jgi:SAM-dependent methyltransferase